MKQIPRRYEKVDANTIKIIIEKENNFPLSAIMQNREQLLKKKAQTEEALKNIDEIIENAKRLGITPKEKDKMLVIKEIKDENPKKEK